MYYLASIRFCDKNCHSPRGNNYIYIINNSIYDKIVVALKNNCSMFKIINDRGYNYRNSDIVFDCFDPINYSDDKIEIILKQTSYKKIIEISENYELSYKKDDDNFNCLNEFARIKDVIELFNDILKNNSSQMQIKKEDMIIVDKISQFNINSNQNINKIYLAENDDIKFEGNIKNCEISFNSSDSFIEATFNGYINYNGNIFPSINRNDNSSKLAYLKDISNNQNERNNSMFNNIIKDFKFGVAEDIAISMYGPAFKKNDGTYVSYDSISEKWIDVMDFILSEKSFCYMMPVAPSNIQIGDFINFNNDWVRIIEIADNTFKAESTSTQTIIEAITPVNMFGFNFYTKLFTFFNGMNNPSPENPFGMLPIFMMMKDNSQTKDSKNSFIEMMLVSNLMGNVGVDNIFSQNPFLYYLMCKDNNSDNLLPMIMLMNLNNFNSIDKISK